MLRKQNYKIEVEIMAVPEDQLSHVPFSNAPTDLPNTRMDFLNLDGWQKKMVEESI